VGATEGTAVGCGLGGAGGGAGDAGGGAGDDGAALGLGSARAGVVDGAVSENDGEGADSGDVVGANSGDGEAADGVGAAVVLAVICGAVTPVHDSSAVAERIPPARRAAVRTFDTSPWCRD